MITNAFSVIGRFAGRVGLERELWDVPKLLNLVMLQFIPRNHSCFLSGAGTLLHPQKQAVLFPGSRLVQAHSNSGYVTDQVNNANQDLPKGDKSRLETVLSH